MIGLIWFGRTPTLNLLKLFLYLCSSLQILCEFLFGHLLLGSGRGRVRTHSSQFYFPIVILAWNWCRVFPGHPLYTEPARGSHSRYLGRGNLPLPASLYHWSYTDFELRIFQICFLGRCHKWSWRDRCGSSRSELLARSPYYLDFDRWNIWMVCHRRDRGTSHCRNRLL